MGEGLERERFRLPVGEEHARRDRGEPGRRRPNLVRSGIGWGARRERPRRGWAPRRSRRRRALRLAPSHRLAAWRCEASPCPGHYSPAQPRRRTGAAHSGARGSRMTRCSRSVPATILPTSIRIRRGARQSRARGARLRRARASRSPDTMAAVRRARCRRLRGPGPWPCRRLVGAGTPTQGCSDKCSKEQGARTMSGGRAGGKAISDAYGQHQVSATADVDAKAQAARSRGLGLH